MNLLIEYNADADANAEIARQLAAASIPALALVYPLPGIPLYGPDNRGAGRIAGRALATFAQEPWPGERVLGVLIGDLADAGPAVADRVQGISEGVRETLPTLAFAPLDTGGQPARADALLARFLRAQPRQRLLIATLDDLAALYAKNAVEMQKRQSDCVIVSQGLDPNIHGGASEKKRSTRATAAAWCSAQSPITWTVTATRCCHSRCCCYPARQCLQARRHAIFL